MLGRGRYTNQPRVEAPWRTLVMDRDLSERPAPALLGRCFQSWVRLQLCLDLSQEFATAEPPFEGFRERYETIDAVGRTGETSIFPNTAQLHGMLLDIWKAFEVGGEHAVDAEIIRLIDAQTEANPVSFQLVGVYGTM